METGDLILIAVLVALVWSFWVRLPKGRRNTDDQLDHTRLDKLDAVRLDRKRSQRESDDSSGEGGED
jgi:hypothetical protein